MKVIKMQYNSTKVLPIEKIISILSYISMGTIGLIWIIIAHILKKKLRFFLMYNIVQSMLIALFLTALKLIIDIILHIVSLIPFLGFIAAGFNLFISIKIIKITSLGLSFTLVELLLSILIIYIILGILAGRIFYIPYLSRFMQKILKNYE